MAAAVDMGEVDGIHSADESVADEVVMNGDVTEDEKMGHSEEVHEVEDDEDEMDEEEKDEEEKDEEDKDVEEKDVEEEPMEVDDKDEAVEEEEEEEEDEEEKDEEEKEEEGTEEDGEEEESNSNSGKNDTDNVTEDNVTEVLDLDDDNSDDEVQVSKVNNSDKSDMVILNDSNEGDADVVIIDGDVKENGTTTPEKDCAVIELDTPGKDESPKKESVTPRRSTRNLSRSRKTYNLDSDKEASHSEESDIEEVLPEDPLAVSDPLSNDKPSKRVQNSASTIVVKDTKRLVEIASKSSPGNTGKKEPTLVIIDTNSILSGRGPIPVNSKTGSNQTTYPVLPVALPAQGVYPPNMRATITPIPMNNSSSPATKNSSPSVTAATPQAPILPSLTDDMFVVEAPSFIVPYVYEKPPVKDLKDFIKNMADEIRKMVEEEQKNKRDAEKENKEDDEEDSEDDKDDEDSEEERKTKKKKKDGAESVDDDKSGADDRNKRSTYFDSPIGKFFVEIGSGLVEEFVQTDLLKQQKRKRDREGGQNTTTNKTIQTLIKNLEYTKENNHPYKLSMKKCEFCNYKTESALAKAFHLETPHMKNFVYRCNFCPYEVRSPHDILFHMEAIHCVRGRLERAPAFHQCPNCPFEDNQKGKLSRHTVACARKFKPERNLEPPIDWEPPAKIPRAPRMKQQSLSTTAAMYQAMAKTSQMQFMKMQQHVAQTALNRGRGRPSLGSMASKQKYLQQKRDAYKDAVVPGGASVLVPTNYQISGNQLYQVVGGQDLGGRIGGPMGLVPAMSSTSSSAAVQNATNKTKTVHQPSISITPLPRGTGGVSTGVAPPTGNAKPGDSNSKNSFVICEICDGYIKDLEQLRNHMQWIHKVKIHPKMIYNRPPLNCQKCQFRFFTDQGLERHLLGSHGLVTSSMQEAANKCKDAGRCPVCGRVYQWKLLNHVARDHNMTLKPAHLSYKCTVCTATFGMYKQFENHVYSAHSVVAKRSVDKKGSTANSSPSKSESLLKPLKINDEITIIPQMPKSSSTNGAGSSKEGSPATKGSTKSKSQDKKEVPLTGSAIESGEIQIINLG